MTLIYLVRHGSTPWGEDQNRYTGVSDIPLSDTGMQQAQGTARRLAEVTVAAVYASPLVRSQETARLIAAPHGLGIVIDPDLREIDFGDWEGMRKADIVSQYPQDWQRWVRDPGLTRPGQTGETAREAVLRGVSSLNRIADAHGDESIVVVGHNTVIRLLIVNSLGAPLTSYRNLDIANCGVSLLDATYSEQWRWLGLNFVDHLRDLG